jgi:MOSC domain-containing protein YiiM
VGAVVAVSSSTVHAFSKQPQASVRLLVGIGVEGDAHSGTTVQHLSRVRADPTQPNLRQVHLLSTDLLEEFGVRPGDLGENVVTSGVDLLALPTGARLRLGSDAVVEVTGLRNPCAQIERFRPGLLALVAPRQPDGSVVRRGGVMSVVLAGGSVCPGDPVEVELPALPHAPLQRV